jgi:hypothetical protein
LDVIIFVVYYVLIIWYNITWVAKMVKNFAIGYLIYNLLLVAESRKIRNRVPKITGQFTINLHHFCISFLITFIIVFIFALMVKGVFNFKKYKSSKALNYRERLIQTPAIERFTKAQIL